MTGLGDYTDAQLMGELDRRRAIDQVPNQVAALTTQYLHCGGTRERLVRAVADAPAPATTQTGQTGSGSGTSGGTTSGGGLNVGISVGTAKT